MPRTAKLLIFALCALRAGFAQDETDAKKAAYAKLAYADMEVIGLFLDLDLDASQASRIMASINGAARKAENLDRRLAQMQQAAMTDMFKVRDALLAGKSVSAAEVPQWMQLREFETNIADQTTAIWEGAYQDVLRRLTREQQARLAPVTDPLQAAEEAAAARLEQQRVLAQRQQGVAQTVLNLLAQARRTVDPDRFRQAAPAAIAQATAGMTGLPLEHPLQQQLNQFYLQRLTQLQSLQPAPYAQARPAVAAELSQATMYVMQQTASGGEGVPALGLIDPARLQAAIRYERTPTLLDEYAKNYRDPLAREGDREARAEE